MTTTIDLNTPAVPGYRHGLTQPSVILRLQPPTLAANLDWRAVDDWLASVFLVTLCACEAAEDVPDVAVVQWGWRVLQLAAQLQRLARLPVFLPGRILQLQHGANDCWYLEAAVVQLPHLDVDDLYRCYQAAVIVLNGFMSAPAHFAEPEALYLQLEATLIGPLSRRYPLDAVTFRLLACAQTAGVPWQSLGAGIYQLGWGGLARIFHAGGVERDSMLGIQIGGNKVLTRQWLAAAGLPLAAQRQVGSEADALQALAELGAPVVVKPAGSVGGQGVTLAVTATAELRAGYAAAARLGCGVVVERQIAGDTHHVQLVAGEVLFVSRRRPAGLLSDGRHSIRQLLAAENLRRKAQLLWQRLPPLPDDVQAAVCLAQQGYNWDSVPAAGCRIFLRAVPSNLEGSQDDDLSTQIHPDNIELACRAARRLGLSMAGVDILSPDISVPWHCNGAVVLEVNHAPQADHANMTRYLPVLLQRLLPAGGRIPVEVFVGDNNALIAALQRQRELIASGVNCFICSETQCLDPQGLPQVHAVNGSFACVQAMLRQPHVQALLVVLQQDHWLQQGIPLDKISRLELVSDKILSPLPGDAEPADCGQLVRLLRQHLAAGNEYP